MDKLLDAVSNQVEVKIEIIDERAVIVGAAMRSFRDAAGEGVCVASSILKRDRAPRRTH